MASQHEDSATAIEEVVAELHRRGVERGQQEYERLLAEARSQAADIVAEAETRKQGLIEEGRREAERIIDSANAEAEQLLQAFLGSLPEIFTRRASDFLHALIQPSFAGERDAATVRQFVDALDTGRVEQLQQLLDSAQPQTFIEALLILAVVFYARDEGFSQFQIDSNLQARLAQIVADPTLQPAIGFEFRKGITGFSVRSGGGREVEVSAESLVHMAKAWVGDEFRAVFNRLLAAQPLPGTSRDV